MMYKVRLTEQAREDLRGIYEYVAYTLFEPGVAQTLKNRIVDGLKSLQQMPHRCPIYQKELILYLLSTSLLSAHHKRIV